MRAGAVALYGPEFGARCRGRRARRVALRIRVWYAFRPGPGAGKSGRRTRVSVGTAVGARFGILYFCSALSLFRPVCGTRRAARVSFSCGHGGVCV